jgi:hypothetical protein
MNSSAYDKKGNDKLKSRPHYAGLLTLSALLQIDHRLELLHQKIMGNLHLDVNSAKQIRGLATMFLGSML